MTTTPDIRYDVASVLNRGARQYQEDAIASDFPVGGGLGYVVLSDGMGGHAAGDIASKIVVTEVFAELKFQSGDPEYFEANVRDILRHAASVANDCVRAHTSSNPDTAGMGATLVVPVFVADRLFWLSIGDSPLYLYRDGRLSQINEDHSLGPQIDFMVKSGMMSAEVARHHPDRNALTSVLLGEEIERIDSPETPMQLHDGDILIAASDGLQTLKTAPMTDLLTEIRTSSALEIAEDLLRAVLDIGDPEQDNVSFTVVKARFGARRAKPVNVLAGGGRPISRPLDESDIAAARNSVEGEDPPVYLKKRWLAMDGGTF